MFIVNDINQLLCLAKFKILDPLLSGSIVVSKFKIIDYGLNTKQQLRDYEHIKQFHIDDLEAFETWRFGRSKQLTDGDLSTIYLAMNSPQSTILLSDEDFFLPDVCNQCGVSYKHWDEVIQEIANEKMVQLYHLIKNAS